MEVFNQQLDNLIKYLDCRLDFYYSVGSYQNIIIVKKSLETKFLQ